MANNPKVANVVLVVVMLLVDLPSWLGNTTNSKSWLRIPTNANGNVHTRLRAMAARPRARAESVDGYEDKMLGLLV